MAPTKVIVHSSQRVSGSNANFVYALPRPVSIDKPYKAYVDQIHIPHTFKTIHAGNRALYIEETFAGPTVRQHKVLLDMKQYDGPGLATELAAKLTAATDPSITWLVTFDDEQGELTFDVDGGSGRIFPMAYLLKNPSAFTDFNGAAVIPYDDAGEIIGLDGDAPYGPIGLPAITGSHISTIPYHVLYLHCDQGLGTGEDAVGPLGNGTVLRSIPVTTSYGQMLHDVSLNAFDFTTVYKGQLQTMKFRLADRYGRDASLSQPFSFSIILSAVDEFE